MSRRTPAELDMAFRATMGAYKLSLQAFDLALANDATKERLQELDNECKNSYRALKAVLMECGLPSVPDLPRRVG